MNRNLTFAKERESITELFRHVKVECAMDNFDLGNTASFKGSVQNQVYTKGRIFEYIDLIKLCIYKLKEKLRIYFVSEEI